ncbi:DUF6471 domain-containing protein [Bradyrhizobium uaiense]|uniref:DUF6471 domain-containing protein n=1 Tax=Bradyrhizobium uaiense TaxID=2594946 RepID=UPI00322199E6
MSKGCGELLEFGRRDHQCSRQCDADWKEEAEARINMKLKRGSFTAIFFLACVAALELEQVVLEEI